MKVCHEWVLSATLKTLNEKDDGIAVIRFGGRFNITFHPCCGTICREGETPLDGRRAVIGMVTEGVYCTPSGENIKIFIPYIVKKGRIIPAEGWEGLPDPHQTVGGTMAPIRVPYIDYRRLPAREGLINTFSSREETVWFDEEEGK